MRYWKGLLIAAAFDAALLGGRLVLADRPAPLPIADAMTWPFTPPVPAGPDSLTLERIAEIDALVDSLMMHLQEDSLDVGAMRQLALLYTEHEWYDAAIGPLARALEISPDDKKLRAALEAAATAAGIMELTTEFLAERARLFVEAVEMWGHGC